MPNWCSNIIVLRSDEQNVNSFLDYLEKNQGKDWFNFFRSCPFEINENHDDWIEWALANWGCKWNCDAENWNLEEEGRAIAFWFDSPWGPPMELYKYIVSELKGIDKWDVSASFHETGMRYVGEFVEKKEYVYDYSDLKLLKNVPEHLLEEWDLKNLSEETENV